MKYQNLSFILTWLLQSVPLSFHQYLNISKLLLQHPKKIFFTVKSFEYIPYGTIKDSKYLSSLGHLDFSKNVSATRDELTLSTKSFLQQQVIIHLYPNDLPQLVFVLRVLNSLFTQSYKTTRNSWWKPKFFIRFPNDFIQGVSAKNGTADIIHEIASLLFKYSILIPIDSEIYFLQRDTINHSSKVLLIECYTFKTLYKCKNLEGINLTSSEWDDSVKIVNLIEGMNPVSSRRQNLSGVNIIAVAQNDADYQPRVSFKSFPDGKKDFASGMCLEVLLGLQKMLSFSYSALEGNGWMGLFPNGSWTGMSGQVVNGEADISISQASTIMMTDQLHGISFLHPTSVGYLVAIFRQPAAIGIRDVASKAFQPLTWICLLVQWIVIIICLHVAYKVVHHWNTRTLPENNGQLFLGGCFRPDFKEFLPIITQNDDDNDHDDEDDIFISESVWWAISTTCCISWHYNPSSISLRSIFTVGYFQAILIFVGFSAAVVMRLFSEEVPIQNFKTLQESKLDVYADLWLPMAHQIAQEVYKSRGQLQEVKLRNHFIQLESAIPRILGRPRGFITFQDAITVVFHRLNYSDKFFCDTVYTVRASPVAFSNAMFVRKGHPLKEIMNPRIVTLIERGVMSRINNRYDLETTTRCPDRRYQYRGGFDLHDVASQFVILISGLILSLATLLSEIVYKKRQPPNELSQLCQMD